MSGQKSQYSRETVKKMAYIYPPDGQFKSEKTRKTVQLGISKISLKIRPKYLDILKTNFEIKISKSSNLKMQK